MLSLSSGASEEQQLDVVELHRDASGSLGLSIAGGIGSPLGDIPVVVANITTNGPAALCQKTNGNSSSYYLRSM